MAPPPDSQIRTVWSLLHGASGRRGRSYHNSLVLSRVVRDEMPRSRLGDPILQRRNCATGEAPAGFLSSLVGIIYIPIFGYMMRLW